MFLAAIAACGGNGDKNAFDPSRADELAHAAMLEPNDLPGGGWTLISEDDFGDDNGDDDSPFDVDTAACRAFSDRMEEIEDEIPGFFGESSSFEAAGKARRDFERTAAFFPSTVEFEIEIYEESGRLSEAMRLMEQLMRDDLFGRCMSDVFGTAFSEGVDDEEGMVFEVTFEEAAPSAEIPGDGGVGKAFTILIHVEMPELDVEFELSMRMEFYFWRLSNAVASVFVTGDPDELTEDEIAGLVAAQAERLAAAR